MDLSVSIRSGVGSRVVGRVINLSEGGMLVATARGDEVGELADFELLGPTFRYAGRARLAHREEGALGLRFLSWDGPATRSLRALVDARLRAQQQLESDRRVGAGQLVG
jgi:hypothetical protein